MTEDVFLFSLSAYDLLIVLSIGLLVGWGKFVPIFGRKRERSD